MIQLVASCDGTPAERDSIPLEQCRAALPTGEQRPARAAAVLLTAGWRSTGDKLLCPGCARATLTG